MTEKNTDFGRLCTGDREELFARAVELAAWQRTRVMSPDFTWALTGGSTPLAWYEWCVRTRAIPPALLAASHFTVSDERQVPLTDDASNFGHAARGLLDPLGVPEERRHPWPVELAPAAAEEYERTWTVLAGPRRAYDLCFLGLGEDAHTASFFPGSPLLHGDGGRIFVALETSRGPRLTVTPAGLRTCGLIVVMALGAAKAPALKKVLTGAYDPLSAPAQILKTCAGRVVWLTDHAAASAL